MCGALRGNLLYSATLVLELICSNSITMKPLSKLWVLCSSQSILMSGAQHNLLEKLLFKSEVGVVNEPDTSFCIHVKAPISSMTFCIDA